MIHQRLCLAARSPGQGRIPAFSSTGSEPSPKRISGVAARSEEAMAKTELLRLAQAKLDEVHILLSHAQEYELAGLARLLGRTLAQPQPARGKERGRRGSSRVGAKVTD
jgi:hypothetical protein